MEIQPGVSHLKVVRLPDMQVTSQVKLTLPPALINPLPVPKCPSRPMSEISTVPQLSAFRRSSMPPDLTSKLRVFARTYARAHTARENLAPGSEKNPSPPARVRSTGRVSL